MTQPTGHEDEPCAWCHHPGHTADEHPLPRDHPQYDAFFDATDDELADLVASALRPRRD